MQSLFSGLAHIAIYTKDMVQSIAFYETIGGERIQKDQVQTPDGIKYLALIRLANFVIELIQPPKEPPVGEGAIPHFALYVEDLDAAAQALQHLGIPFLTEQKKVLPTVFGGLQNWFFQGPSGEQIELLQMLSPTTPV